MTQTIRTTLAALFALTLLANCAPLVGAAAVVGADAVAEEQGDNLF